LHFKAEKCVKIWFVVSKIMSPVVASFLYVFKFVLYNVHSWPTVTE